MPDLPAISNAALDPTAFLSDPSGIGRLVVGLAAVLLLVAGARLYRLAIVAPGVAAGVLAGLEVMASADPTTRLVAALALGVIGGVLFHLVERLAVSAAGALLLAGLAHALSPLVLTGPEPWYVPVAAALVGVFLFPRLYRTLLPVITAVLGALGVAWAAQRPEDVVLIGGLSVFGLAVQLFFRRRARRKDG